MQEDHDYGSPVLFDVMQLCRQKIFENHNINRIIIPLGGKVQGRYLLKFQHFVTICLDFNENQRAINVNIIDSFGNLLANFLQHNIDVRIKSTIYRIFLVAGYSIDIDRQCLNQQSITDNVSCGFFTLRIIKELIENSSAKINIPEAIDTNSKVKSLLWMKTSRQWVAKDQCYLIYNQSKKYLAEYGTENCILQVSNRDRQSSAADFKPSFK